MKRVLPAPFGRPPPCGRAGEKRAAASGRTGRRFSMLGDRPRFAPSSVNAEATSPRRAARGGGVAPGSRAELGEDGGTW